MTSLPRQTRSMSCAPVNGRQFLLLEKNVPCRPRSDACAFHLSDNVPEGCPDSSRR